MICEICGCLQDDHQYPEDVDDGIPFAIMSNGGDTEIITCGDCADCYADPRDWADNEPHPSLTAEERNPGLVQEYRR